MKRFRATPVLRQSPASSSCQWSWCHGTVTDIQTRQVVLLKQYQEIPTIGDLLRKDMRSHHVTSS